MRQFLAYACAAAALAIYAPKILDKGGAPRQTVAVAAAAPEQDGKSGYRTLTLRQSANGHYETEARLDGRRMSFLIDTGASVIALRESDAARLGIHPRPSEYTSRVATANGTAKAAPVDINRVEVGDISVRDVRALVMPDSALGMNLMGMSFLSRIRFEQRNGRMVLEQ